MPSAGVERHDGARVISIVGPTASGKTGLGIAIARRLADRGERAEIVNADAYQMYRGMDIGTAKASDEERAAVRHHLLDVIEPSETMSVARFQQMARATIADLKSRGIRPILVGGSGLYARAAIDDISFPGTDPQIREHLEERERTEGATALFRELAVKDPQAAEHMDPRNPRRIIRALEVIEVTGKPYSATLPRYRYVIPSVQLGLDLDRADLDDTMADIAQKTKRLARKQMGWFGRDPRIHWLSALNPALVDNAMAVIDHADAGDYDAIDMHAQEYVQHHLGDIRRPSGAGPV